MFRITPITKYLLAINIVAYFATAILGRVLDLNNAFGLHFILAPDFQPYQLLTYMFMHGGFAHLFFNMFALWMFGCVVEDVWGGKRFIFYYILCGIGAGLFQEMAQFGEFIMMCDEQIPNFQFSDIVTVAENSATTLNRWTTVGASGAIYAILLAFGMLFPEQRIFIFPLPIPIKAKWFVIIYAAIELFSALSTTSDGVAHVAHLGGMVIGYVLIRYWRRHPYGDFSAGHGHQFFDNLRSGWERRKGRSSTTYTNDTWSYSEPKEKPKKSDWDYNAEKVARQKEIDAILDKIRKSGYDSLSTEEKQKLFDSSKN